MQAESDAAAIDKREEAPKVWNGQQTLPRGLYTKRPGLSAHLVYKLTAQTRYSHSLRCRS